MHSMSWTLALGASDAFTPGDRIDTSVGWAHAMSQQWSVLLQANLSWRGRDQGANAEPALSGSTRLNLSPGASFSLGEGDTAYALVQLPVVQKVNGIQLVPKFSLAFGWTHAF